MLGDVGTALNCEVRFSASFYHFITFTSNLATKHGQLAHLSFLSPANSHLHRPPAPSKTHSLEKMVGRSTSHTSTGVHPLLSLFAVVLLLALTLLPAPTNAFSLHDLTHLNKRGVVSPPPKSTDRSFAIRRSSGGKGKHGRRAAGAGDVQMRRRGGKGVQRLQVGEDGHY